MKYLVRIVHTQEFESADTDFETIARLSNQFVHDACPDNTKLTLEVIPLGEAKDVT